MTAQSMLIHFNMTAINQQAHASTRATLDGNALVALGYNNLQLSCQMELFQPV